MMSKWYINATGCSNIILRKWSTWTCPKRLHFRAMALLNFTSQGNSLPSIPFHLIVNKGTVSSHAKAVMSHCVFHHTETSQCFTVHTSISVSQIVFLWWLWQTIIKTQKWQTSIQYIIQQMTIQEKRVVFIKNGSPTARYHKAVHSARFISISETLAAFGLKRSWSVDTPDLQERMLHLMEQDLGTSMSRTATNCHHNTAVPLPSSNVQGLTPAIPQELRSADGIFTNVQPLHFYLMFCTLTKHDFCEMALPQYSNENPTHSFAVKATTLMFY
jgi:hypothetical protein